MNGEISGCRRSIIQRSLLTACAIALILIFNNFAMPLLPDAHRMLLPAEIKPESPDDAASHAYVVAWPASAGDLPYDNRYQADLYEDGTMLHNHAEPSVIRSLGKGTYGVRDGRLIFSASDNSDPRTNGRDYDVYYPPLTSRRVGYAAVLVFGGALLVLSWLTRRQERPLAPSPRLAGRFRWHLLASSTLLLTGLYCSTGTLSPYANTSFPHVIPPCDYLYNGDHVHFKALFDFVDGQPKSTWNGALLIRRILFPVLCYPFMKLWGFEIGGTIGSIVLNLTGFVVFLFVLRRQVGERGAVLAGWLLAFYPGITYWGGLPYMYSFISPGCLLATAGLVALQREDRIRRVAFISTLMGIAYLGYDLIFFFLPASLLVLLVRRRRPIAALGSLCCQMAPLALWLLYLSYGLHQHLENTNSGVVDSVVQSYLHPINIAQWLPLLHAAPDIGLANYFGANFLFLPALFLALLAINPVTSRVRFQTAELALLAVTLSLFLFNNLAPPIAGPWQMRGSWVARLYQPVFPAFIYFSARWFQALPPLRRTGRLGIGAILLAATVGNCLVVFGPILDNPWTVSEEAFYRFYDHNPAHDTYEANLSRFGRRPLGFCAHDH
jgi:hypothetical protein